MKQTNKSLRRSKGLVIWLTVLALPFLLMLTGLALDSGRSYLVKAKLYAALDAAGIAAARAVANGNDAARSAANKYFLANIPNNYLDSNPALGNVNFSTDAFGNISIDLNATAQLSNNFLNAFGFGDWGISAQAQTVRRPVDLVLVVDNTTSLKTGSAGDVTQDVIDRSKSFVKNFNQNFDRISVVKFAFGAETPVRFHSNRGHNRQDLITAINNFTFGSYYSTQFTNASEGFYRALDGIRSVNNPATLKVIVFFTDGSPNTFASRFDVNNKKRAQRGAIRSGGGSYGTPAGLWKYNRVASRANYYEGSGIDDHLEELPEYYNAHSASATEFKVLNPNHPRRPVTQYNRQWHSANDLYKRVNRISRNLVEDMAEKARQENIYVFTLGLGSSLTTNSGPDSEKGEDFLLRMANDPKMKSKPGLAGDFKPSQLEGVYCHAVDEEALGPCFDQMLDVIIRLTL